jgi:hypothetical protein
MSRLIYSMLTPLDGYTEDKQGRFGWGAPEDEGVHSYVNELASYESGVTARDRTPGRAVPQSRSV